MNIEELRDFCLSLKGSEEDFPFDEVTMVFKVQGKMFALIPLDNTQLQISLKCNPRKAEDLRVRHNFIEPARHFNKKHWNTLFITPELVQSLLIELIEHSYQLVVSGLTKKEQQELEQIPDYCDTKNADRLV